MTHSHVPIQDHDHPHFEVIIETSQAHRCPASFIFGYEQVEAYAINTQSTKKKRVGKGFYKHTTILYDTCFVQALPLWAYCSAIHPISYTTIRAVGVPLTSLPQLPSQKTKVGLHARSVSYGPPTVPSGMESSATPGGLPNLRGGPSRFPSNQMYHAMYLWGTRLLRPLSTQTLVKTLR